MELSNGQRSAIPMDLVPDACDVEAGDWLDPDGIGLGRYPNEINVEAALAACTEAVSRAPQIGRFHYQLGRALQALRRYQDAQGSFETARDLGHARAWFALGELRQESAAISGGRVAEAADLEVLRLYGKGVEAGDPYAYHALGKQFFRYGETEAKREYGFDLLGRAIELGHTFAMNELGIQFLREGGPNYQPERGLSYLRASAERNDIYGLHNLGIAFEKGQGGLSADPARALDLYKRAAAGGHPYAPVDLGRMYFRGLVGEPDLQEAIRWYDAGLSRGIPWGGTSGAFVIASRGVPGFDMADAAMRAAKASVLRDRKASDTAGKILANVDARSLDAATQRILSELGEPIVADGLWGANSRAALSRQLSVAGETTPEDAPLARLQAAARAHWKAQPFRIDLY